MYHPAIVERNRERLLARMRQADPGLSWRNPDLGEILDRCAGLEEVIDADGQRTRALTRPEERFVAEELAHCVCDAGYFLRTYYKIQTKGQELQRLILTPGQATVYQRIADLEWEADQGRSGDGILLMALKARQVGISTLSEGLISHRVIFYPNTNALLASDVEPNTEHIFDMMERGYDHLPWWMKPHRLYHKKSGEMFFDEQDSHVTSQWGKNTRGGATIPQGQIGTGKTIHLCHLTELALWPNADQIDDSLVPAIPQHARTFVVFESTAKGRGNWWHRKWQIAKQGIGRFQPVFVPWYLDPGYRKPVPVNWQPGSLALAHAARVKSASPEWCGGTAVDLTREQLYWWEATRAAYAADRKLAAFLAEFAADDLECFQNTTAGPLDFEALQLIAGSARMPDAVVTIRPKMEAGA